MKNLEYRQWLSVEKRMVYDIGVVSRMWQGWANEDLSQNPVMDLQGQENTMRKVT